MLRRPGEACVFSQMRRRTLHHSDTVSLVCSGGDRRPWQVQEDEEETGHLAKSSSVPLDLQKWRSARQCHSHQATQTSRPLDALDHGTWCFLVVVVVVVVVGGVVCVCVHACVRACVHACAPLVFYFLYFVILYERMGRNQKNQNWSHCPVLLIG